MKSHGRIGVYGLLFLYLYINNSPPASDLSAIGGAFFCKIYSFLSIATPHKNE